MRLVLPEQLWGVAAAEQEARRDAHPWEAPIGAYFDKKAAAPRRVLTAQLILWEAVQVHLPNQTEKDVGCLRTIAERLGWRYGAFYCPSEKRSVRGYLPKE